MSSLIHGAAEVAWQFIVRVGTVVARTTRREVFKVTLNVPTHSGVLGTGCGWLNCRSALFPTGLL